jgi:hypothetical protein
MHQPRHFMAVLEQMQMPQALATILGINGLKPK